MLGAIKKILRALTRKERYYFAGAAAVFIISSIALLALTIDKNSEFVPIEGGIWREGVVGQPRSINPVLSSNPVDLDISALVFSRLYDLIQNYEISDEGRIHILKLKEDLRWDDGERLTSDDVVFTVKIIQSPDNRSPLLKSWQGVVVERESEIQVKFTLPTPYAFFEENLKRLAIIPKHIWDKIPTDNLDLSLHNLRPVGNGPYRFKALQTRRDGFVTEYRLQRNPYFAGEKAYITDFYFNFYENEEELLKAFRLRRINGFGKLVPINGEVASLSNTVVEKVPMPRYYAVFMNPIVNSLLKDKNLRLALGFATPFQKLVAETTGQEGEQVTSPILWRTLGLPNPSSTIQYNPEEAKKLLEKVKPPKSKDEESIELNLIVPQINFLVRAAEILREAWLKAGVKTVNIIVLSPGDMVNEVIRTRNYEMVLFGNVFENPEDLYPFWHSSQRFYPGLNLSLYQNFEVDRLIELIRQTNDPEKRKVNLEILAKTIMADYPAIPLFSLPYYYIHSDRLEGFSAQTIVVPSDRFKNVEKWNIFRVRVLK
jgi:peptide/nickel transport system substrate-binding protein